MPAPTVTAEQAAATAVVRSEAPTTLTPPAAGTKEALADSINTYAAQHIEPDTLLMMTKATGRLNQAQNFLDENYDSASRKADLDTQMGDINFVLDRLTQPQAVLDALSNTANMSADAVRWRREQAEATASLDRAFAAYPAARMYIQELRSTGRAAEAQQLLEGIFRSKGFAIRMRIAAEKGITQDQVLKDMLTEVSRAEIAEKEADAVYDHANTEFLRAQTENTAAADDWNDNYQIRTVGGSRIPPVGWSRGDPLPGGLTALNTAEELEQIRREMPIIRTNRDNEQVTYDSENTQLTALNSQLRAAHQYNRGEVGRIEGLIVTQRGRVEAAKKALNTAQAALDAEVETQNQLTQARTTAEQRKNRAATEFAQKEEAVKRTHALYDDAAKKLISANLKRDQLSESKLQELERVYDEAAAQWVTEQKAVAVTAEKNRQAAERAESTSEISKAVLDELDVRWTKMESVPQKSWWFGFKKGGYKTLPVPDETQITDDMALLVDTRRGPDAIMANILIHKVDNIPELVAYLDRTVVGGHGSATEADVEGWIRTQGRDLMNPVRKDIATRLVKERLSAEDLGNISHAEAQIIKNNAQWGGAELIRKALTEDADLKKLDDELREKHGVTGGFSEWLDKKSKGNALIWLLLLMTGVFTGGADFLSTP